MRFCSHCGAQLSPENKFCPSCGAAAPVPATARDEQPTQAVPAHDSRHEQPTQAVPAHGSSDEETRAVPPSGASAYASNTPYSASDDATRAVDSSSAGWRGEYPSTGASTTGYASDAQYDSSGHVSGHPGSGDASGYSSAPYQREQAAPTPPASSVSLSDGGRSGGSSIGRILAAAAAVVVLGGGTAFAYNSMKGDDDKKTSSSAPSQSGSSGGSPNAGAAPVASADSKPKTMPDLKGKSIDEAQALLSSAVTIETTKTNLMEGMSGGAVISAQETAAGQATPDTVKVTLDQPANVTYVDTDNSLVVDSNPFSTNDAQVAQHTYKHYDSREMYWSDNDDPQVLKLNLNRAYSRLRTDVAIDSNAKDQNKTFTVIVRKDGTQVWNQQIKFGEQPKQIDLDMTNALRVEIEVSIGGGTADNQGESSQIVFGDLRVLAEPGKGNSSPSSSS